MAGRIYVRKDGDDGAYVELQGRPYQSEDLLQDLLARHPDLLSGDHDGEPPRWLFVSREMGVPDAPGGNGRWAVDHLFPNHAARSIREMHDGWP